MRMSSAARLRGKERVPLLIVSGDEFKRLSAVPMAYSARALSPSKSRSSSGLPVKVVTGELVPGVPFAAIEGRQLRGREWSGLFAGFSFQRKKWHWWSH